MNPLLELVLYDSEPRSHLVGRFVVGFGLDYKQLYRNLGYIAALKPEQAGAS